MKKVEIKGIIPPIVTPMFEDETINTEELRRQVDRQIENGVHGIFCFGTNGEGYILKGKGAGAADGGGPGGRTGTGLCRHGLYFY